MEGVHDEARHQEGLAPETRLGEHGENKSHRHSGNPWQSGQVGPRSPIGKFRCERDQHRTAQKQGVYPHIPNQAPDNEQSDQVGNRFVEQRQNDASPQESR